MKVGIVGAGMIVHDFLTFAHEVTGMELVALCATPAEKEKIVEMCQANNIKAHYTNIDVMLEDSEVEVVYVAVPNHLHMKRMLENNNEVLMQMFSREMSFLLDAKERQEEEQFKKIDQLIRQQQSYRKAAAEAGPIGKLKRLFLPA